MNEDTLLISIVLSSMRGHLPPGLSLEDRLLWSMRYVRDNERDLFYLSDKTGHEQQDLMFRAAIGVVMAQANDVESAQLMQSIAPLRALGALLSGLPIDVDRVEVPSIKLMSLWHQTAKPDGPAQQIEKLCNDDPDMTVGEAMERLGDNYKY